MRLIYFYAVSILALVTVINSAQALTMQEMFNQVGVTGNVTGPGAYNGQTQNTLTGGSLVMHVPTNNYQLMNLAPPKISGGCNGISIFGGAYSFIDKQQFVDMLKNIGQAATSQAFYMALDSLCPMCGTELKTLSDTMNKANWNNINTCETGKAVAQFASHGASKMYDSLTHVNETEGPTSGANSDTTDARAQNSNPGAVACNAASLQNSGAIKLPTGNLAYEALKNYGGAIPIEQMELFMSVTGTLSFVNDDNACGATGLGKIGYAYIPPTITDFMVLMGQNGDTTLAGVQMISCSAASGLVDPALTPNIKTTCDNPGIERKDYNEPPFKAMTHTYMRAIADALRANNRRLEQRYVDFINASPLPVYKMLAVATSFKDPNIVDTMINNYSDLVAAEYARSYIEHIYDVTFAALNDPSIQLTEKQKSDLEDMKKSREKMERKMGTELAKIYASSQSVTSMAETIRFLERTMNSSLPNFIGDSMKWQNSQMGGK